MPTRFRHPGLTDTDRVDTVTDVLVDNVQEQVRTVIAPKIAKLSRNALNVMPVPHLYFQRLAAGRRCSCWGVMTDPSAMCVVCYGTGLVGGYVKRGTHTTVVDVTYPARCVNVAPNYQRPSRPIGFSLLDTAVYGYIDTEIVVPPNMGLDNLTVLHSNEPNSYCEPYVRAPNDTDWVPLNEQNVRRRLGNRTLQLRIRMHRMGPKDPVPYLAVIRLSVFLIAPDDALVKVDIPRVNESKALQDIGLIDVWSQQNFYLDSQIKNVSTDDFFYNVMDGSRWKAIEVKSNVIAGTNTSWDVLCRLITSIEPMYLVPIGMVPAPSERPPEANLSVLNSPGSPPATKVEPFPDQLEETTTSPARAVPLPFRHVQQGPMGTQQTQADRDSKKT